jgi:hypothetical protein
LQFCTCFIEIVLEVFQIYHNSLPSGIIFMKL